jgi:hypothetical protein
MDANENRTGGNRDSSPWFIWGTTDAPGRYVNLPELDFILRLLSNTVVSVRQSNLAQETLFFGQAQRWEM